jgi:hypothetical protein
LKPIFKVVPELAQHFLVHLRMDAAHSTILFFFVDEAHSVIAGGSVEK